MFFKNLVNHQSKLPFISISILVSLLIINALPNLASFFVYYRESIQQGELWRLFTGHFVHFTPLHLGIDLLVFCLSGFYLEYKIGGKCVLLLITIFSLSISTCLFLFANEMLFYGGFSGLNYALFTYVLMDAFLHSITKAQETKKCIFLLSLLLIMLIHILMQARSFDAFSLTEQYDSKFVIAWQAHLAGYVCALLSCIVVKKYHYLHFLFNIK